MSWSGRGDVKHELEKIIHGSDIIIVLQQSDNKLEKKYKIKKTITLKNIELRIGKITVKYKFISFKKTFKIISNILFGIINFCITVSRRKHI